MADVVLNGPAGRLEARMHIAERSDAPVAVVLHPHPLHGGSMHNKVTYLTYQVFADLGFTVVRFNFRGVGRSEGKYDNGEGELSDAASIMDWLQIHRPMARAFWVAGFSFGSWIGMQLLMRRPEIRGFISVAPPASVYDFSFLAPCPVSGLMVYGDKDDIVPPEAVESLVDKLSKQKGIFITQTLVPGADHFFKDHREELRVAMTSYMVEALQNMVDAPLPTIRGKTYGEKKEDPSKSATLQAVG